MKGSWFRWRRIEKLQPVNRRIARRDERTRLRLEQLEDRVVPTVVFEPYFGAETMYNGGGPVLRDTPVYLLYWGSYWNTSSGAASEAQLTSAVEKELNSPIYNRLGSNYGTGPVYLWGTQNGGSPVTWNANETGGPADGFSDTDLQNAILGAIDDPNSHILSPGATEAADGGHAPIYFVVTPPNIASGQGSGVIGYHSNVYANTYYAANENVLYGWSDGGSNLLPNYTTQDLVTLVASHELGEAITDPDAGTGPNTYYVGPGNNWPYAFGFGEIGDFEPAFEPTTDGNYMSYQYRINGSLTQALWDNLDQAFTVSNGTRQNFTVYSEYQYDPGNGYYFYSGNELAIQGDQFGGGYNDNITIDETSNGGLNVVVNGESVTFDPGQITTLIVYTGAGANNVSILSTPSGMQTFIDGQGYDDTVTIGNSVGHQGNGAGNLGNINGFIDVYGNYGNGTVHLNIDDSGDSLAQTAFLTGSQLTGLGNGGSIDYGSGVTSLSLDGGSGNNAWNVNGTASGCPVTINGGSGDDTFYVGVATTTLDGIQGTLTINGGKGTNTLNVFDQSSSSGQTYTLSKTTLTRSGAANIVFAGLAQCNVTASNGGNDALTILSPTPTIATTFAGGSGTNTLTGANVNNTWTIKSNNGGTLGKVTFSNFQNLIGGIGVDTFKFTSATASTVLSINGGGAPTNQGDWLDYSSFGTSAVTVNLATGSASNVNGGAAGGITGIQNVIGSSKGVNHLTGDSQGNILIGGSGSNTIVGGSGNSLLIGGSGGGSITGGSGEDILIAGTTTYSPTTATGRAALMAILAELQSSDTFAQQVSDLINGNGTGGGSDLNGKDKLTWGVTGATVKASTGKFQLYGDTTAATTADWFFANSSSTVNDFNDDGVNDEHNNNAIGVF